MLSVMCVFITKVSLIQLLLLDMFMRPIIKILTHNLFAFLVLKLFFHEEFTPHNDRTPKFASIFFI